MKRAAALLCIVLLVPGCSKHLPTSMGGVIMGEQVTVAATAEMEADSPVVLHGTMIKKCPVAGCWFVLTDQTGTIKVDLKNSEFVVVEVPLKTKMIVGGRVMTNETERFIEASGVRF